MQALRIAAISLIFLSFGLWASANAQIPAFLPNVSEVPPSAPTAIDGLWKLDLNGADFRIQAGRAFAATSYLYLFVLNVQPGMVTAKDIVRHAPGEYHGYDLPTAGPWKVVLQADNTLAGTVNGPLGPIGFKLTPIQLDDPAWLEREVAEAQGGPAAVQPVSTNDGSIYPPDWEAR